MNLQQSPRVPLTPSLRKGLYEAIVMLYCLTMACVEGRSIETSDVESDTTLPRARVQTFHCFVNKLAHICDSRRGGKTVTSFAILQTGVVEYWFASNRRRAAQREEVRLYVSDILTTLGNASADDVKDAARNHNNAIFSQILRKILCFNRPRIESYARMLMTQLGFCIDEVEIDSSDDCQNPLSLFSNIND